MASARVQFLECRARAPIALAQLPLRDKRRENERPKFLMWDSPGSCRPFGRRDVDAFLVLSAIVPGAAFAQPLLLVLLCCCRLGVATRILFPRRRAVVVVLVAVAVVVVAEHRTQLAIVGFDVVENVRGTLNIPPLGIEPKTIRFLYYLFYKPSLFFF